MPSGWPTAPRRVVSLVPVHHRGPRGDLPGAARRGDGLVHAPERPCGATGSRHQEPRPQGHRGARARPRRGQQGGEPRARRAAAAGERHTRLGDRHRDRAGGARLARAALRRGAGGRVAAAGSRPPGREWAGPCPSRPSTSPWRSGATRGWPSGATRSPATSWPGSAGATSSPAHADRYPHVDLTDLDRDGVDRRCCPTSPTSSPPTTAPRRSRTRAPRSSAAGCSRGTARVSSAPGRQPVEPAPPVARA